MLLRQVLLRLEVAFG
jgi:hypothetical protein